MPPRVVDSCGSKFHHFELARQLERAGMLEFFYTGYPRWRARREGLPREKLRVVGSWELYQICCIALGRLRLNTPALERVLAEFGSNLQDSYLDKHLPDCDVFIGLSGSCQRTARRCQSRGGMFICDRGSSHIRFQDRILREEHARWKIPFQGVDLRRIEKEEAEYALADAITVPSRFSERSFHTEGISAGRVHRVSYGANLSVFRRVAEPPQDAFDVLFVGQVSLRKGVPYLLEAFARLRHPHKSLTIVGAMQPCMREWLRHHVAPEHVRFLGRLPQRELKEYFSRSHVFVLASIEEGLALVLGQAMACGCPVIASANSGGEDLLTDGKHGYIVPIRDSTVIREKLELLAASRDLREELSAAAQHHVQSIGGWDTYGDEMASLISRLVEQKRISATRTHA